MTSMHVDHSEALPTTLRPLAVTKCHFFSALVDSIEDDVLFYIIDVQGRFTFVNNAAESLLCRSADRMLNRHVTEFLSDGTCNQTFRSLDWKADKEELPASGEVELLDGNGDRIRLKFFQTVVQSDGSTVGVSGMMRRTAHVPISPSLEDSLEDRQLMDRVQTLSLVERQVVELVVDGNMNKKMASLLDVAVRTVESRRSRAMLKLQAKSLSDLVQLWIRVRQIEGRSARTS
jgi:PAS domain S-box-containing protein